MAKVPTQRNSRFVLINDAGKALRGNQAPRLAGSVERWLET
jgi:hypothetical protein